MFIKWCVFIQCLLCITLLNAAIVTQKDILNQHLSEVLAKRWIQQHKIPANEIIAQIKARIHTQMVSKISASISQKVKTNLKIKVSVMGGTVRVDQTQIEAIQTAAVDGLESHISNTLEKKIDKIVSNSLAGFDTSSLNRVSRLLKAETIIQSQLQLQLPDIQKTLHTCLDTQLKTHIQDVEIDIPGILKIQIEAQVDVTSSIQTIVQHIYQSYADVSIALAVYQSLHHTKKGTL
ncbi:uncharacterized protein B0P05DRAFT_594595 [Gilbertella persicaria]|uniref:uncharacterized protein n=1 Tax=Gilbertella persicaria TaxID=101096 RepID=UPI00222037EB|nr:uncharacterized protein B0P05DRAFT_594595 [Gilbertella persicaria]KAI8090270.1 hypothetical protein B0P05DRAFT_594595 [Gilbertella persicaria]